MNLVEFFRIAASHFKTMMLAGVVLAGVVFYLTRNEQSEYSSHTLVNTGLVSGYNIESSGGEKVDYAYTNNEIENLISLATSYETREELAMRLLARYIILTEPDPELITLEGWEELKKPEVHNVRKLVAVPGDTLATYNKILALRNERKENDLHKLLYSQNPFFGVEQMETIQVMREGKSDMLRFKYSAMDPAVCRQTLVYLTHIFVEKQCRMKAVQSADVLDFFDKATKEAQANLNGREDGLLAFMVSNKIINYYEQTRFIAAKKEDLDEMYFKELMNMNAADSSMRRLEREMGKHVNISDLNSKLVQKRQELGDLSSRIARMEVFNFDSLQTNSAALDYLHRNADLLKKEIKNTTNASFAVNRTPEGVELKDLLTQWLNQVVGIEQSVARLEVLKERKIEFDTIYSKFAPWGSRLKRMEREIDVAERAYLENLHSYNQARLHQYSMMMSANLKVVDPPFMPLKPAGSKRMMSVVIAFMAGFVLVLAGVVALEMLDNTLKSQSRAAEVVGLEVVGAFPKFPAPSEKAEKLDFGFIQKQSVGQLLQHVKLNLREQGLGQGCTKRVGVASTRSGEGKSYLTRLCVEQLRATGERVAFLFPEGENEIMHADDRAYKIDHRFFELQTEAELLGDASFDPAEFDFIYFEIPGLLTSPYPVDLVGKYDLTLLFTRANRVWNEADTKALATFSRGLKSQPHFALNALEPTALESSLGELPKRRSLLRKWAKRIVLFDFSGKKAV
ncbi:MAG: hypothetical protein GC192_06760 [Bacteroidetes bacterium]|nr:hypothetical protein [Bacteroidota bacterium]